MEDNNEKVLKRGRRPLTDIERQKRVLDKKEKQKEFYHKNKKYFCMKYNSYLLDKSIDIEFVRKKLENSELNYELLKEIYGMKLSQMNEN